MPQKTKCILVGFITCLVLASATFALADQPIKLLINNEEIQCDVPPQNINGRVLVPARFVAEPLGADVAWDSYSNSVVLVSHANISLDNWLTRVENALQTIDSLRSSTLSGTDSEKRDKAYNAAREIDELISFNVSCVPPDKVAKIHPYFVNLLVVERERFEVFAEGVNATLLSNYQQASRMLGTTDYLQNRSRQLTDIITAQLDTI